MPTVDDSQMLALLQTLADMAPAPLYPAEYAKERGQDRDQLDATLDELRRRGLVQFTEWIKGRGQGYALTEGGKQALATRRLTPVIAATSQTQSTDRGLGVYERGEIVRDGIYHPRTAYGSYVLIAAILAYFVYGAYLAYRERQLSVDQYLHGEQPTVGIVLPYLGGLSPRLVFPDRADPDRADARPQYERLVLFLFLHIGMLHLAMNLFFLYMMGTQIEAMWGTPRFLVIYFVSGIVSGCVILMLSMLEGRDAFTAGASGSLYGVFVAMIVWFALNYEHLPEGLIQDWSRGTLINAVILIAISFVPGVSWQGHFGGAVGGLLAALILHVQWFHPSRLARRAALVGVAAVPAVFFLAVLWQAGRL